MKDLQRCNCIRVFYTAVKPQNLKFSVTVKISQYTCMTVVIVYDCCNNWSVKFYSNCFVLTLI